MRPKLYEVIEVISLCIGYTLVGAYAALSLQVDPTKWFFFVLHLISGIVLLELTTKMINRLSFLRAPSLVFVLMSSFYYVLSSTKYFTGLEFYPQFAITTQDRFYGSMAVFFALLLCLGLIRGISSKFSGIMYRQYLVQVVPSLPRILLLFLVTDILLKASLTGLGYGPYYWRKQLPYMILPYWGLIFLAVESIVSDVVVILSAAIIVMPKRAPRMLSSILPFMGIGLHLLWAIFMKSRSLFLIPVLSVGICISLMRKLRTARGFWRWVIFLVFAASTVGSPIVLDLLGRPHYLDASNPLYASVAEVGYRADLSDFAVAYIRHRSTAALNFGLIAEGIMNMIPRALWPSKAFVGQYERLFLDMGWPAIDYPDTFFSSGALVAGWLGFFLVPLGFVIYVEIGYRVALSFIRHLGGNIVFVVSYLYLLIELLRTEMDWNLFFLYHFRAPLIAIILIYVSSWHIRLRRKGRQVVYPEYGNIRGG